jgi:hypothetical protein
MIIDRRGSAKVDVAFENKNTRSGPDVNRSRSQSPEAGADHDRIELPRHGTLSYDEPGAVLHGGIRPFQH